MVFNCSLVPNGPEAGLLIFQRVAYTPVFILGLILNTLVLWRFTRIPKWTETHIFMLNLLLADLLLTLFLPFRIYETYCPMERTHFCTFLISVHYVNMYVSIFTITAISIHRYIAVRFSMHSKSGTGASEDRRKKITSGACAFIWVLVITINIIFRENMYPIVLKTCYERDGWRKMSLGFLLVLEIIGYLLPIVTITICSTQTIWTVLNSIKDIRQRTEEDISVKRKRAVAIITANMIVFIVCFTPIHVAYLLRYIFGEISRYTNIFYDIAEWLATTNCCLDSVGYYFLLKKVFRDKT
ncbi:G-protein coupled receptor 35-like [Silurus meridionalis]|nr:G-protein coupled receptor 35-like [Silurus meridionalis]